MVQQFRHFQKIFLMYEVFLSCIPSILLKIMNFKDLHDLDSYGKRWHLIKVCFKDSDDF